LSQQTSCYSSSGDRLGSTDCRHVPLPPVATQCEIVAEIEAEQRLVDGTRQLVERMEQKIAAAIARIWGEEKPAPTEA